MDVSFIYNEDTLIQLRSESGHSVFVVTLTYASLFVLDDSVWQKLVYVAVRTGTILLKNGYQMISGSG